MNKIDIGDRVKVYGFDSNNYFNEGSSATVCVGSTLSIWVKYDDRDFPDAEVSPKQCRKLVKRRRWGSPTYE